jgi:hypothetical protein
VFGRLYVNLLKGTCKIESQFFFKGTGALPDAISHDSPRARRRHAGHASSANPSASGIGGRHPAGWELKGTAMVTSPIELIDKQSDSCEDTFSDQNKKKSWALENSPCIDNFPSYKPQFTGGFQLPCLMAPEGKYCRRDKRWFLATGSSEAIDILGRGAGHWKIHHV